MKRILNAAYIEVPVAKITSLHLFPELMAVILYGFDQQGWYGMFVTCGIWCLADVSSVSPSSEQTKG